MATLRYKGTGTANVVFNVPMYLLKPTKIKEKGSVKNTYPDEGELIFVSFRTFGGTEKVVNDTLVLIDTAVIDTWWRPDIKADCLLMSEDGTKYEILGTPENLNHRNQKMKFKVRALKGGA